MIIIGILFIVVGIIFIHCGCKLAKKCDEELKREKRNERD